VLRDLIKEGISHPCFYGGVINTSKLKPSSLAKGYDPRGEERIVTFG